MTVSADSGFIIETMNLGLGPSLCCLHMAQFLSSYRATFRIGQLNDCVV